MKRYGGELIYRTRDDWGVVEVVEDDYERSLHFGTAPRQSSMHLGDPVRLALSYTRAMLAPLLWHPEPPRRALLLGLGGGSLVRFLRHHFPDCDLDVVELRESVVRIARDHFLLPDTPRLRIHVGDAADFMRNADTGYADYDMLLLDAFDAKGIAASVCGFSFFAACHERLAPTGWLAANLWAWDTVNLMDMLEEIGGQFSGPLLRLPVSGKDNVIALAQNSLLPRRQPVPLQERARELEQCLDVEFLSLLRTLRKHNPGFF